MDKGTVVMGWLMNLLIAVQVVSAASIIILVLLQHGKGADMGAAFGGGASGSLFGASGSANFLSRTTAVLATVFFLVTIGLAYTATNVRARNSGAEGVMGSVPAAPLPPPAPQGPADLVPGNAPAPSGGAAPAPAQPSSPAPAPAPARKSAAGSDVPK